MTSPVPEALSLSGLSVTVLRLLEGNSRAEPSQPPSSRLSFKSQREVLEPFPNTWRSHIPLNQPLWRSRSFSDPILGSLDDVSIYI